jgi:hypothetical protein
LRSRSNCFCKIRVIGLSAGLRNTDLLPRQVQVMYRSLYAGMWGIVTSVLFSSPCDAQGGRETILRRAVAENWLVRVHVPPTLHEGRITWINDSTVRVADVAVSVARIQGVDRGWIQDGRGRTGGIIGAALVGSFLYGLSGIDDNPNNDAAALLGGAAAGFIVGGMIGRAASPAERIWTVAWP